MATNQSEKIQRLMDQMERVLADIDSEKETRKRRNEGFDRDIKELRDWKNKVEGSWMVLKIIVGILCTVVAGLILFVLTKK